MNKTITVKGIGKASTSPDYVILSLGLKAQDKKYDQAMAQAAEQIQQLKDSLFQNLLYNFCRKIAIKGMRSIIPRLEIKSIKCDNRF